MKYIFSAAWLLLFPGNSVEVLQMLHIFNDWSSIRFPFPNALIRPVKESTEKHYSSPFSCIVMPFFNSIQNRCSIGEFTILFRHLITKWIQETSKILPNQTKNFNNNSSILLDRRFEKCHETWNTWNAIRLVHSFSTFQSPLVSQLGKSMKHTSIWLVMLSVALHSLHHMKLNWISLSSTIHSILNLNVNPYLFFFSFGLFFWFPSLRSLVYFV